MDMPKYTHIKSEISGLNNDDAFHNEDVLVEFKKKNDYKMLPRQTLYCRTGRHIIFIRGKYYLHLLLYFTRNKNSYIFSVVYYNYYIALNITHKHIRYSYILECPRRVDLLDCIP